MINLKLLYKIIGSLLFIETTMFLVCLGVAIGYEEEDVFIFACSVAISASAGNRLPEDYRR
jgi:trk system potassium uptake protein TrkH